MELLTFILILFCSFMLRLIFILGDTSDDYFHLWNVGLVKKNKTFICPAVSNSIIKGYKGYSSLPHAIISLFPKQYWVFAGKILNIAWDILSIILLYFLVVLCLAWIYPDMSSWQRFYSKLTIIALYSFSPILFPISARLKTMGGRVLGNLINIIYFTFFVFAYLFGYSWCYLGCIIFGLIMVYASQFGLQK